MSRAVSPSAQQPYGTARVARVWAIARSTLYAQRARATAVPVPPRRRGPSGPCSDAVLVERIKGVLAEARFVGEGHRKVWARLRLAGLGTSRRRVLRLMREHHLLAPHRVARRRAKTHDGTITTAAVNMIWGTDMTDTVTVADGVARVFVAVDHCNSECVGIHAAHSGNRFEALEPIRQGVRRHCGGFAAQIAAGLALRHDHGSNYMSRDFQAEIAFLGIASSPSFVREPEGNGVAERFIRTLKENFLWVYTFDTIEALRQGLIAFAEWYNRNWLVARHGYQTPAQVRTLQLSTPKAALPLAA